MEIKIKNKIKVGDQTEIIEEIHTCEVMEKGDYTYLVHHNSEKEKVVIKLNQDELVMTRFSNPKSIMRFSAKVPALVHIPTPLGTQPFLTDTSLYDPNGQTVDIHYQLKHPETEDVFADYELEVSWF
ncbi:DUF1934 domain-containing protein [Streptococcus salivarius]|uniref:DUF1934 domain-containing protein n=1 Tax=Streptococcus salivarius TaxID=1304 RepID=UPI0039790FCB